ncbi:Uma2 family endonuclease [Microcoleus sp.]|uniref:Uma2 family endonuclease n=1 Tax=Microcoleus sp. TaxID=44472 RepID=UPI0035267464
MVQKLSAETVSEIIYPDSDGEPMSDNTKQFRWIVTIKENLEILFANILDVFVAGDLLWYPVQGNNKIRQAPDAMVVFGRPKGDRGSYEQWKEDNIPPQVAFEILSPGNRSVKTGEEVLFYQRYGVQEYYIYDPDNIELTGFVRDEDWFEPIAEMNGWVSPLLEIRFELTEDTLEIYRPDGRKFLTPVEMDQLREQEREEKEIAQSLVQQERQEKEIAQSLAQQERQEKEIAQSLAQQERQEKEIAQSLAQQERQRADEAIAQLEQERQRYQALLQQVQQQSIDSDASN